MKGTINGEYGYHGFNRVSEEADNGRQAVNGRYNAEAAMPCATTFASLHKRIDAMAAHAALLSKRLEILADNLYGPSPDAVATGSLQAAERDRYAVDRVHDALDNLNSVMFSIEGTINRIQELA